ncbi:phospholipase A [uncultured Campylobacter sp.]|uniref:phospholipase A n=1 Tax=uncultured Campylobacter sp. TaxID=218934 RepID=UPI00262B0A54|nr:phospholipase A [uncultured Campylobacter sp.]
MKKIVAIFLTTFLYANALDLNNTESNSTGSLYIMGQKSQDVGDIKSAMRYYKLAYELSKEDTNESQNQHKKNIDEVTKDKSNDFVADFWGIRVHEPNYLIWSYDSSSKDDRRQNELNFQLSLEKPLYTGLLGLNESFFFGYTQISWWQIFQDSSPFRDTNYQPEFFLEIPIKDNHLKILTLGLLHQSNGKDGLESRSVNKAYLESKFEFDNFKFTPRIWHAFSLDKTNKDFAKYYGYGELNLSYEWHKNNISLMLRNNLRKENKGAARLSWSYSLKNGLGVYLHYFSGYGESLADYKNSVDKIAIGFVIVK